MMTVRLGDDIGDNPAKLPIHHHAAVASICRCHAVICISTYQIKKVTMYTFFLLNVQLENKLRVLRVLYTRKLGTALRMRV